MDSPVTAGHIPPVSGLFDRTSSCNLLAGIQYPPQTSREKDSPGKLQMSSSCIFMPFLLKATLSNSAIWSHCHFSYPKHACAVSDISKKVRMTQSIVFIVTVSSGGLGRVSSFFMLHTEESLIAHVDTLVSMSALSCRVLYNNKSNSISDIFPLTPNSAPPLSFFFFTSSSFLLVMDVLPFRLVSFPLSVTSSPFPFCEKFHKDQIELSTQPRSICFGTRSQLRGGGSNFWKKCRPNCS